MPITEVFSNAQEFAKENPLASSGIAIASLGAVAGITALAVSKRRKKKNKTKKTKYKRTKSRNKRRNKRIKYARTVGKRKDKSMKRIRMTKNGQPYVIMANGRARFISKKSARLSRKRKGGRY